MLASSSAFSRRLTESTVGRADMACRHGNQHAFFFSFAFRHVDAASFFSFAFRSHIAKSNALRESSCRLQSLAGEVAWQENRCENFHNLQCLRSCVSLLGYVLLVACGFLAAHSWRAGGGARMNPERTKKDSHAIYLVLSTNSAWNESSPGKNWKE